MKLVISVFALVLLAAGVKSDLKEELQKIDMACRAETNASEDELKTFFKGDLKDAPNALKCHLKCLMEKQGHWNNGGFDSATALKQLQEIPNLKDQLKEITKVVSECKDKKGSDECDTAYLVTKCIIEHHALPIFKK